MRLAGWRRTLVTVSGTLAAVALLAPASLQAQKQEVAQGTRLEFVPFAGVLAPMGKLVNQGGVTVSHKVTFVVGGRLDAWFSRMAGVELAVAYAPSGYHAQMSGVGSADTSGTHLSASARLIYRFANGAASSWQLYVGGGLVSHGGAGMEGATGTTDASGVVGLAACFRLTPALALQATAEDYVYQAKFGVQGATGTTEGKINNDLMLSLGLMVPLGGGR